MLYHSSVWVLSRNVSLVLAALAWLLCRYSAEVDRLKATFHEQAQADVDAMQEAVAKYRAMFEETQERVERLNVQKQLLMKQVCAQ